MEKKFITGFIGLLSIRMLFGVVVFVKLLQGLSFFDFLRGSNLMFLEVLSWFLIALSVAEFILKKRKELEK